MGSLHAPSKRAVMLPDTVAPERREDREREGRGADSQVYSKRAHVIMSGITTAVVCHVTDDHRAAPRRFWA